MRCSGAQRSEGGTQVSVGQPTRRDVLLGGTRLAAGLGLASVVSACAGDEPERPDPVESLVEKVVGQERALLARYRATAAAHPGLRRDLAPFVRAHEAHLAALVGATPSGSPSPAVGGASPSPSRSAPPVPATPRDAVAELARAERAASQRRRADVLAAPATLARLLASVGAAEASHHALLAEGRTA